MTPVLSRRTLLAGTAAAAGLGVAGARPAAAAVARPSVISCASWGAAPARNTITMVGPPTKILIHHTASANVTDYSRDAAYAIARDIQTWHFGRGWADTGQHFTVSRGGYVLEGRHRTLEGMTGGQGQFPRGAHCTGENDTSLGIENQGIYTTALPTSAQWNALVGLCAYLCQTYRLSANALYGHRQFRATACPGDAFYARLPQLRKDVAARLSGEKPWPTVRPGASGFRVTSAQHLLREAGQSVTADGTYDDAMTPKVKAFQTSKGLVADGVIGRLTWESPLAVTLREEARGEAVRAAQVALNGRGKNLLVDGVFGGVTATAVKEFQRATALVADGVVGQVTWSYLLRS
ncbi:hypothetical protein GCM10027599_07860 [Yimella radicis]